VTFKADLFLRAAARRARIILPEGDDPRIREAAERAAFAGLAEMTLISSDPAVVDGVTVVTPRRLAERYVESIAGAASSGSEAAEVPDPVELAAHAVAAGDADGAVMGAVAPTAAVLRATLRIVGTAAKGGLVSSSILMVMPADSRGRERVMLFADPAVVPEPTSDQLAAIGASAVETWRSLVDEPPRVAFLSFSTRGSAAHPRVDKVRKATEIFRDQCPDVLCDGEIQVDAAIVPEIAKRKCPDSSVAGRANILVFPDLDSGNIGYKLTERLGGATAIGPVLQGLRRPIQDLSRGCSASDVVDVTAITALLGCDIDGSR